MALLSVAVPRNATTMTSGPHDTSAFVSAVRSQKTRLRNSTFSQSIKNLHWLWQWSAMRRHDHAQNASPRTIRAMNAICAPRRGQIAAIGHCQADSRELLKQGNLQKKANDVPVLAAEESHSTIDAWSWTF